jgi:hypothetical protein
VDGDGVRRVGVRGQRETLVLGRVGRVGKAEAELSCVLASDGVRGCAGGRWGVGRGRGGEGIGDTPSRWVECETVAVQQQQQ